MRVLIVEDDLMMLSLLEKNLGREFYLDSAMCAADAIELLKQHAYDAVVCDFGLPDRDGSWLLKLVKREQPAAKRVLYTGWPERDEFEHVKVCKTTPITELVSALQAH